MTGTFAQSAHGQWSHFRDTRSGRRGLILANLGRAPLEAEEITLEPAPGRVRLYQPFSAVKEITLPISLTIPAERVLLLIET